MATQFENETCGRCGGSGKYSFNHMEGDRCRGCHGTGYKLTKRGAAAKAFFTEKMTHPVSALAVGDYVFESINAVGPKSWLKLVEIIPDALNDDRVTLRLARGGRTMRYGLSPKSLVVTVKTEDQRLAFRAEALAYQETLTKTGKPAKRATKKEV